MKTAIIFSGHLRCFKDCYESISRNVLIPSECDVFMHLYDCADVDDAISLYKPKNYIVTNVNDALPYTVDPVCRMYKASETDTDAVFSMWNNIKRSFELIGSDYDCVIKARYDIKFSAPLNLKSMNMECINIPEGGDWRGGMFDMFAVSSYENMNHYCHMVDFLNRYTKDERILFHPEILLRHHIREHPVHRFPFPVYLRKTYERGILEDKIFTVLSPT